MAFGYFDVVLTVDNNGLAQSPVQFADYLHNFATKCALTMQYKYEFVDQDGFGIYMEPSDMVPITGPYCSPINRRVRGFSIRVYEATVGETITFRVAHD